MMHHVLIKELNREVRYHLLIMMIIKLLQLNLILITKHIQTAEKWLFHMQVGNMSCLFFSCITIFSNKYDYVNSLLLFLYHQPNWNPEEYPEQNCCSKKITSDTKHYRGKQKR